ISSPGGVPPARPIASTPVARLAAPPGIAGSSMFRLEKLELNGFKSFSSRTEFAFGPGITAVVGPNGCGKSNIADSINWVIGTQSSRALRAEHMGDVIFNGSDGRRPMGMAEVSLHLVAANGHAGGNGDEGGAGAAGELDAPRESRLDRQRVVITRRL